MRWVEEWTKDQAWGYPHTPKNIQEVKASKLGDAPRHPFFIGKNQVTFQDTIFLLLHALCVFLGASLLLLSVYFALFAAINGWITSCLFGGRYTPFFIAKNTLVFTLIVPRVFSFSTTVFSFHFSPWFLFRSCYIFTSRCIWTSGLCWFSSKKLSRKGLNGVVKEKKFYAKKSGTKRSLFRLRLRLLHVVLDVIFIVCLVVLL
jgi:hypothetical protein